MTIYVYILRCADGRYYVGSTRGSLKRRVAEHNSGAYGAWTVSRRPVALVYQQAFANELDAIVAERQLKSWGRAKKEALIRGDGAARRSLAGDRPRPPAQKGSG